MSRVQIPSPTPAFPYARVWKLVAGVPHSAHSIANDADVWPSPGMYSLAPQMFKVNVDDPGTTWKVLVLNEVLRLTEPMVAVKKLGMST
jgi:hypothetical protein